MRCLNCMKEYDEKFGVCPHCGQIPGKEEFEAYQIPPGSILGGRYLIGTSVGVGGFGITYRAWDNKLDKLVAIKEYYPSANGIVNRAPGQLAVIIYSGQRREEFIKGKERFLSEARNMARFNTHPNIVHVFDFFEENNTAYIAMEFLDGISYKQFIAAKGGIVETQTALDVTFSVLDALKEIHKSGIIHRDISPDNIFICQGGMIKLIDFGAARFSTGESEKTLSIILKPGYAPPEQYRSRSRQGPWTDLYAVGAMLYRAITGKMPEESVNRIVEDHVVAPHELNPEISETLSNSIMRAMALNPELRFRNVDQFKQAIQSNNKVLNAADELSRRKKIRIGVICGVAVGLCVGMATCIEMFQSKSGLQAADIVVWYPVDEEQQDTVLERFNDFESSYKTIKIEKAGIPVSEYEDKLKEALRSGENVPTVFDSSCLSGDFYEYMAPMDEVYDWLEDNGQLEKYHFLDQYKDQQVFKIPLSFDVPVVYVNSEINSEEQKHDGADGKIKGNDALEQMLDDINGNYSVSEAASGLWRKLMPDLQENYGYEDFVLNLAMETSQVTDGENFDVQAEKEKLLSGKTECYLSDTSEYQKVQKDMAGLYKVYLLNDMEIPGKFTESWSVSQTAQDAEKAAGIRLVYSFLSKENQMKLVNGLPVHKETLQSFEKINPELQGVGECMENLKIIPEDQESQE